MKVRLPPVPTPVRRAIGGLALLVALAVPAAAAACERPAGVALAVGLHHAPPFVSLVDGAPAGGLNVELWEEVAGRLAGAGLPADFAYVDCPLEDQLAALADGRLDAVISPLTITAARMDRFDFTVQYLASGLTALAPHSGTIDFADALASVRRMLLHPGVPVAVTGFLLANLVLAWLLWMVLRRAGGLGEGRPAGPLHYYLEAVLRTLGLKGVGDRVISFAARVLESTMAVIGTVLSAIVFGVLTSALVNAFGSAVSLDPTELLDRRVAVVAGETGQDFVEQTHALHAGGPGGAAVRCQPAATAAATSACITLPTAEAAVRALLDGQAAAVVGDWARLSYLARQPRYADRVLVQSDIYHLEPYGWGLARAPREGIDRAAFAQAVDAALLEEMRSLSWRPRVESYLGTGTISPD